MARNKNIRVASGKQRTGSARSGRGVPQQNSDILPQITKGSKNVHFEESPASTAQNSMPRNAPKPKANPGGLDLNMIQQYQKKMGKAKINGVPPMSYSQPQIQQMPYQEYHQDPDEPPPFNYDKHQNGPKYCGIYSSQNPHQSRKAQ